LQRNISKTRKRIPASYFHYRKNITLLVAASMCSDVVDVMTEFPSEIETYAIRK